MKNKFFILVLVSALLLTVTGLVIANGGVVFPRWVLSGGATNSSGNNVIMHATLGQPVSGVISSSTGDITLSQGFWHEVYQKLVYLPLVKR